MRRWGWFEAPMHVQLLQRSASLTVLHYRCSHCPSDAPFDEEHHAFSVSFVQRGSFGYHSGRITRELVPGATLIGRRGDVYRCTHDHHHGGDACLSFHLSDESADRLGLSIARWRMGALPPLPQLMALGELAGRAALTRADLSLEEAAFTFVQRFADVVTATSDRPVSVVDRRRAVRAALLLDERYREDWALERIAGEFRLSPFHFLKVFRGVLGVTPHQYLVRARLRHAAALLCAGASVTRTAYDVGFGDLSNFVRTFHRDVGVSPSAFRNAARGDRKILQVRRRGVR